VSANGLLPLIETIAANEYPDDAKNYRRHKSEDAEQYPSVQSNLPALEVPKAAANQKRS
jgi:hypothetical protein